jgi:pyruvate, orthophosphate dikinase
VFDGALPIEAPDESDDELLTTVARWASVRAPLRVVPPTAAAAQDALDLSGDATAADPQRIGEVLAACKGARGARGGAIASDEGVRAAIAAGLEFIVADPVLPPLLAAARIGAEAFVEDEVRA